MSFRAEYPKDGKPSYTVIKNILSYFEKYGSVLYVSKKQKIMSKTRDSQKSVRKLGLEVFSIANQESFICRWCFIHTFVSYFSWRHGSKPYKFHLWHKLENKDFEKSRISPIGSLKIPSQPMNIQYAVIKFTFIKRCLWKSKKSPIVSVAVLFWNRNAFEWSKNYILVRDFPNLFFEPQKKFQAKVWRNSDKEKYYFQQDDARPPTAKSLQTWLNKKFNNLLIDKGMWRSSHLNPCDFYLCNLESLVFNLLS